MFAAVGLCAPGSAAGLTLGLMPTPKRGGGAGTVPWLARVGGQEAWL